MSTHAEVARTAAHLTGSERRHLLLIQKGLVAQRLTRPRRDVSLRLIRQGFLQPADEAPYYLTADGEELAAHLRNGGVAAAAERPAERPVDVIGVMVATGEGTAPDGGAGAVARMLLELDSDRERVAVLTWLASPDGAAYLGQVKDNMVVAARRGRSYAQVADYLGVSERAVNKAVTRANARQRAWNGPADGPLRHTILDSATPTGG